MVVMFENRSFDDLLGRLYEPGEVAAFEGTTGKELSNPIPAWAEHRDGEDHVPPPAAATPQRGGPPGQMDFAFGRVGYRRPQLSETARYRATVCPSATVVGFIPDFRMNSWRTSVCREDEAGT